jgi:hypothetical protein
MEQQQQPPKPDPQMLIHRDLYWRLTNNLIQEQDKNNALVNILSKETETLLALKRRNNALRAKLVACLNPPTSDTA